MKKWLIILTAMLLFIPIVSAATIIQISTDNLTWVNITDTQYGGSIDETNRTAYTQNLNEGTTYYFRARNSTTNWQYISQTTTDVVLEMILSLILGTGLVVLFFLILGIVVKKNIIKFVAYTIAFIESIIVLALIYGAYQGVSVLPILRVNFLAMLVIGFGFLIVSLYFLALKLINPSDDEPENPYKKF